MLEPFPSHVWTGRAPSPTLAQRCRQVLRSSGRTAVVAAVPVLALALVLSTAPGPDDAEAGGRVVAAAAPGHESAGLPAVAEGDQQTAPPSATGRLRFAAVDGVDLFVTSPAAKIVGFHEASYPTALAMLPVGRALAVDNGSLRHQDAAGPNFVIMGSRGRPTPATSAVDIAQEPGSPVVSPVSGTVTDVSAYALYGRYPDNRIEIAPAGRPDLRVVVLHVTGPQVSPGQQVVAGETRIAATATPFPFASHVDRYAGGRPPHVHVEVKRV